MNSSCLQLVIIKASVVWETVVQDDMEVLRGTKISVTERAVYLRTRYQRQQDNWFSHHIQMIKQSGLSTFSHLHRFTTKVKSNIGSE